MNKRAPSRPEQHDQPPNPTQRVGALEHRVATQEERTVLLEQWRRCHQAGHAQGGAVPTDELVTAGRTLAAVAMECSTIARRGWPVNLDRQMAVTIEEYLEAAHELMNISRAIRNGEDPTPWAHRSVHELIQLAACVVSMAHYLQEEYPLTHNREEEIPQ